MKKLLLAFCLFAGVSLAQTPTQCLASGTWVPCSLITGVQEAQAVNTKVSAGSGTTITNAFGAATTPGNAILCIGFESAAAIPVFTDAQSNTYAVIASSATAPGYTIALAQNIVGLTTDTITLTTTSGAASFACHELKGQVLAGQAWALSNGQQGTGASITFAPTTASTPNEMVFLGVALGAGTVNATPSLGGNNTSLVTVDAANTAVTGGAALSVMYAAHTNLSDAKGFTQTVSLNASQTYSAALVSVKPARLPSVIANPTTAPAFFASFPASQVATYSASKVGLATVATPTDIAVLSGNATNTVVLTGVNLSCTQTTAGIIDVRLLLRTTADSGGTSTGSPASYSMDSNNSTAVSSVLTYTANPTVNDGTDRVIDSAKVGVMAAATAVPNDMYIWRPTMGQTLVLRGTAQQAALNLNGVTLTGGSCDIRYTWMEIAGL
jgi:hypothetical protein